MNNLCSEHMFMESLIIYRSCLLIGAKEIKIRQKFLLFDYSNLFLRICLFNTEFSFPEKIS